MEFRLWTDDAHIARAAAATGVARIGPDLEFAGKAARQRGTDSLQSHHSIDCLPAIRDVVGAARLFARCNPPAFARGREIATLLDEGVTSIMLPMVRTVAEAADIARQIGGRATLTLMIEHADALPLCRDLARIDGVQALYVGINDLALSLGLRSRFAALTPQVLDPCADAARASGVGFGFFGLARAGDTSLPVPSDLVFAEWARLDVNFCIIARSFRAPPQLFAAELAKVRTRIAQWDCADASARATAHAEFRRCCEAADLATATRAMVGPAGLEPATKRL